MNEQQRSNASTNSVDRRDFIRRAGLIGGGLIIAPSLLAACGDDPKKAFTLGTWPLYIENDQNPKDSPTIKAFTKQSGYSINYKTDVDDNSTFTALVQPKLVAHKPTGYDVVVLTSWMCDRWIQKGWATPLDNSKLSNKKNLLARHAKPSWDPNRKYTMPYAEGQVGIAYYPKQVGFEIKSFKDLLDPRIKGKVSILSEVRDSLGSFMLADGVDPTTASIADAKKSLQEIKSARDKGQFRKITGNSYTDDLGNGDTVAAMAWSGDVVALQEQNPELKWVAPAEGQMSFVDTMMIPAGAKEVAAAHAWINFLYDPTISAHLMEAISYVSPVDGAIAKMSAKAAASSLINPPATAKIHEFRELTVTESDDLDNAFTQATQL